MFILDTISPFGHLMPRLFMSFAEDGAGSEGSEGSEGEEGQEGSETPPPPAPAPTFSWKNRLPEDLAKSPSVQKYKDDVEGLVGMAKGVDGLSKLLGHDKVPIPKGPEDTQAQALFNKAMGIPNTADGYNLPDAQLPGELKDLTFDKAAFSQVALENNLTPKQAEGLWNKYTQLSGNVYQSHKIALQTKLNETINALRSEWGDAYGANVELGQMVISKFAEDQEMGDFLTAALSKDPKGLKFLAKIGTQFAENKVGDFKFQKFAMSPDEAKTELDKVITDPNHPYMNSKAPIAEHEKAVEYVNNLRAIISKRQA